MYFFLDLKDEDRVTDGPIHLLGDSYDHLLCLDPCGNSGSSQPLKFQCQEPISENTHRSWDSNTFRSVNCLNLYFCY